MPSFVVFMCNCRREKCWTNLLVKKKKERKKERKEERKKERKKEIAEKPNVCVRTQT